MKNFKAKLTAEIAVITVLLLSCFGLLIGKLVLFYYDQAEIHHLTKEGQLVSLYLSDVENGTQFEKKIQQLNSRLDVPLLIMEKNGGILYKVGKNPKWPDDWERSKSLTKLLDDIKKDKQNEGKIKISTGRLIQHHYQQIPPNFPKLHGDIIRTEII